MPNEGQNKNCLKNLSSLQNKAIRIINFKQEGLPVNELYNANGILKMEDYIYICLTFSLSKMYYQMNL